MFPPPKTGMLSYRAQRSLVSTPAREGEHRPADHVTRPMTDQHMSLTGGHHENLAYPGHSVATVALPRLPSAGGARADLGAGPPRRGFADREQHQHSPSLRWTRFQSLYWGDLTLSGDDHIMAQELINFDTDSEEIHVHENAHLTGTDDQGNAYIGNIDDQLVMTARFDASGQGQEETSEPLTFVEISQGAAPNFIEHAALHLTLHADGTITGEVIHLSVTCQG